jgi:hypothetical protein
MKCVEVEKHIDSFIDNELRSSLGRKVELHLKECSVCEETFESLQALRRIVGKEISVSASSQLDGRVMQAFSQHHSKQRKSWWSVVFGQIVIPKPAIALALLTFAVFTGLAFQLGKMSATDIRLELPLIEMVNLPPQISEQNLPSKFGKETEEKTINDSNIRFIEVPVIKEKIVTRVVYVTKPLKENAVKVSSTESKPDNFTLNSSVNENRYSTQVDLKEFQPVAEIKTKIIKKDENYEK